MKNLDNNVQVRESVYNKEMKDEVLDLSDLRKKRLNGKYSDSINKNIFKVNTRFLR